MFVDSGAGPANQRGGAAGPSSCRGRVYFFFGSGTEMNVIDTTGESTAPIASIVVSPNPGPAQRKLMLDSVPWFEKAMEKASTLRWV